MLPTAKESQIHSYMYNLGLRDKPMKTYKMNGNSQISYAQHLYIINDEEIKEGDYIKFHVKPINKEWIHQVTKQDLISYPNINNEGYKVITTTDTFLKQDLEYVNGGKCGKVCLPQPSPQFVEKYIKEYNKGNIITDVVVEYSIMNTGYTDKNDYPYQETEAIKIDSNNCITITKVKDNWNREELISLLHSAGKYGRDTQDISLELMPGIMNQWIEQNL
jgi:hypothetical protein